MSEIEQKIELISRPIISEKYIEDDVLYIIFSNINLIILDEMYNYYYNELVIEVSDKQKVNQFEERNLKFTEEEIKEKCDITLYNTFTTECSSINDVQEDLKEQIMNIIESKLSMDLNK